MSLQTRLSLWITMALCVAVAVAADSPSASPASTAPKTPTKPKYNITKVRTMGVAHGVVMCMAYGCIFPMAAVVLRVVKHPHVAWIHGLMQCFALTLGFVGIVLGIMMGKISGRPIFITRNGHKLTGIIIWISAIVLMPALGAIHHRLYKQNPAPTLIGLAHRMIGRGLVIAGAVNVGLGVQVAHSQDIGRVVPYTVVTTFFVAVYIALTCVYGPESRLLKARLGGSSKTSASSSSAAAGSSEESRGASDGEETHLGKLSEKGNP